MPILFRAVLGRAGDVLAVEFGRDGAITSALEVEAKDPLHDRCGGGIDGQDAEFEVVRGAVRVGVWWAVDHKVSVGRTSALVAAFVEDLRVHAGAGALLNMLAFGLAEPAEHVHHHRVGDVVGVVAVAELGHPDGDVVGVDAGCDEAELVAEPAAGAFTDNDAGPASVRVAQVVEEFGGFGATMPRHRA
ncbi:hypothetical protein ATM97_01795 [Nocardia sp. MH4]|nr:hypothetical protein [Nocardia sp. MH4]